jgi:magnesium-transporting ATPase (P-type)
MKSSTLTNWNFMRIVRLVLGIAIIVQSVLVKDWGMTVVGILFTSMPIFNIGCCANGGCWVPLKYSKPKT